MLHGKQPHQKSLCIDIGGGSTEVIFAAGEQPNDLWSVDLGAVRLTELFDVKDALPKKKLALMRKAHAALPEGGCLIAVDNVIDDARRRNAFGLLMSLNMLIEFGDAFDYTGADFDRWAREVGFRRTEVIPLAGPGSAAVAYK